MLEIRRNIYDRLIREFDYPKVTLLIGARQVGKTHLMRKLHRFARRMGKRASFFDLEQPETMTMFNKSDKEILDILLENEVVFIDEFYYMKNASHLFKAVVDRQARIKIFASGSSSLQIHKHLRESLAGRKRIYHIFPCSYVEMQQVWKTTTLEHILVFGGLPGISLYREKDILMYLSDIHQSYILKDVKSLIREENMRAFNHLIYLLAENQGSVVAPSSLAPEIGLSPNSIEHHISILSETMVLHPVFSYSRNMGNELKKSKKFYLYDIGIRNMILKDFRNFAGREDGGFLLETFVFLELNQLLDPLSQIRFWRTKDGKEVDFIFVRNRTPFPVEVKTRIKPGEIPSGLSSFLRRYPDTRKAFVLNLKEEGETRFHSTSVFYRKIAESHRFLEWIT